jgi:DNA-binding HxlR family transcriptional regulator
LFELNKTAGRNARSNKQVRMHEQLAIPIRSRGRSADLIEIHSSRQPNCESVVRIALSLIQGKWKIAILAQLEHGPVRLGELRRRVPGASKKMLTQHLREMERDGLILRTDLSGKIPHVEYSLTAPLGTVALDMIRSLIVAGAEIVRLGANAVHPPRRA